VELREDLSPFEAVNYYFQLTRHPSRTRRGTGHGFTDTTSCTAHTGVDIEHSVEGGASS